MNRFVRFLSAAAMALVASTTAGAAEEPAGLPVEAKDMAGFVPAGWTLIKSADGDLNKDGLADLAGVLEEKVGTPPDPAGDGPARILFVAFRKPGGGYRLSV